MSMLESEETEPRIQVKHVENIPEDGAIITDAQSFDVEPSNRKTDNKTILKTKSSSEIQSPHKVQECHRRNSAIGNESNSLSENAIRGEEKIRNIPLNNENLLSKYTDKKYATSSKMRKKSESDTAQENTTLNEGNRNTDRPSVCAINNSSDDILALVDLGPKRGRHNSAQGTVYITCFNLHVHV